SAALRDDLADRGIDPRAVCDEPRSDDRLYPADLVRPRRRLWPRRLYLGLAPAAHATAAAVRGAVGGAVVGCGRNRRRLGVHPGDRRIVFDADPGLCAT